MMWFEKVRGDSMVPAVPIAVALWRTRFEFGVVQAHRTCKFRNPRAELWCPERSDYTSPEGFVGPERSSV